MNDFEKSVVSLIRYALDEGETFPSLAEGFDYAELMKFSERQQLLPLVYYGASKTETFRKGEFSFKYLSRVCAYIGHNAKQMKAFDALCARFEADGIDYMPIKGARLKQLYPLPEMRIMSDCDILIREEQKDAYVKVMTELGYATEATTDHVHEFESADGIHIELHRRVVPAEEADLFRYYGDGWWTAKPIEGQAHAFEMRPEDHLVFLFAHFVKHYRGYGAGVKYVVDFEVFRRKHPEMDDGYINEQLEKLGLDEFYANVTRMLDVWFRDTAPDEITDYLTDQLFYADSVYGSADQGSVSDAYRNAKNAADGKGTDVRAAKRKRAVQLVFLPYQDMCKKYPVLIRWAILLPLFWMVRAFDVLFHRREQIGKTREQLDSINDENISRFRDELNYVGLDKPKAAPPEDKKKKKTGKKKKGSDTSDA